MGVLGNHKGVETDRNIFLWENQYILLLYSSHWISYYKYLLLESFEMTQVFVYIFCIFKGCEHRFLGFDLQHSCIRNNRKHSDERGMEVYLLTDLET